MFMLDKSALKSRVGEPETCGQLSGHSGLSNALSKALLPVSEVLNDAACFAEIETTRFRFEHDADRNFV